MLVIYTDPLGGQHLVRDHAVPHDEGVTEIETEKEIEIEIEIETEKEIENVIV
jgi:hypothetical protein